MSTEETPRARLTVHTSDKIAAAFGVLAGLHRRSISSELELAVEAWLERHRDELEPAIREIREALGDA